jgi:uncharacterized protein (DUF433 family)
MEVGKQFFENLAGGLTLDEILDSYPTLKREQALGVLQQAESLLLTPTNPIPALAPGRAG